MPSFRLAQIRQPLIALPPAICRSAAGKLTSWITSRRLGSLHAPQGLSTATIQIAGYLQLRMGGIPRDVGS